MTKTRTLLWRGVNGALTLLAAYTAFIDLIPKGFPESRSENIVIAMEGIVAWIASYVVWRLRCGVSTGTDVARQRAGRVSIYLLYAVGFTASLALYALRVFYSDYR